MKTIIEQPMSSNPKLPKRRNPKKLQVIVDSNFLLVPAQFGVDIFEEMARILNRSYEPVMTLPTYRELQKIAEEASPKLRQQAAFALKLVRNCRMINVEKESYESHDNLIVRLASAMQCCVATNDRELKKKLRNLGVPVIYLRQKTHLAVEGEVPK